MSMVDVLRVAPVLPEEPQVHVGAEHTTAVHPRTPRVGAEIHNTLLERWFTAVFGLRELLITETQGVRKHRSNGTLSNSFTREPGSPRQNLAPGANMALLVYHGEPNTR